MIARPLCAEPAVVVLRGLVLVSLLGIAFAASADGKALVLEQGNIAVDIPEDFTAMTKTESDRRYPNQGMDAVASPDRAVSICAKLQTQPLSPDQLTKLMVVLPDKFREGMPTLHWIKSDLLDLHGTHWAFGEYITHDSDGDIHNLTIVTAYHGLTFLINFNVWAKDYDSYRNLLWTSVRSTKIFASATSSADPNTPTLSYEEEIARGDIAGIKGNLDEAENHFGAALALQPGSTRALTGLGTVSLTRESYDKAIKYCTDVVTDDPNNEDAWLRRGTCEAHLGDFNKARKDVEHVITLKPSSQAYTLNAQVTLMQGDLDSAYSNAQSALAIQPKNADATRIVGWIALLHGDTDKATRALKDALALKRVYPAATYDLGCIDLINGQLKASLRDFQTILESSPKGDMIQDARLLLWVVQSRQGNVAFANAELSTYLQDEAQRKSAWAQNIGTYLVGRMSESQLIESERSDNAYMDKLQHHRVWYFIGIKRLVEDDEGGADDAFDNCVADGLNTTDYTLLARTEAANSVSFARLLPRGKGAGFRTLCLLALLGFAALVCTGIFVFYLITLVGRKLPLTPTAHPFIRPPPMR